MSLFEVSNLEKTYFGEITDTKVLRGLTFKIEKGEFVSIMGPSGSGKSTLLHILGFLSDHTSGEYRFNGKRYEEHTDTEVAKVRNSEMGFVFQSFNLLPRQTVFENVQLPLMYSKFPEHEWEQRVKEVVEIVDLSHRLEFETYKLSGGEKQRVAIARALVNNPDVIFADEPTGNLDSKSGQAVMQTLQQLHDELGHTVILITHETKTAEYADRMIRIVDGVIESDEKIANRREAKSEFIK
ncbi:MAG: ABC transporter ATP-binding protein [Candidatus Pacebacteria bacterium]|nr:ABC transporter ATP-binding protein [Candidatus Paceibacterota bacterium]MCF7857682.1 ABC transporter ATP-binding protein [Candidatus Paceibacterota bacterium]